MIEINNEYMSASFQDVDICKIRIIGSIKDFGKYKQVSIIAPNTFDKKSSYSGQGLPFPCANIAFENTPNKHTIGESGTFDIIFDYPNSFYTVADKKKIVSPVYFSMIDHSSTEHIEMVNLKDKYELRTLINRVSRNGPEFYSKKYDLLSNDTAEANMMQYSQLKQEMKLA